MHSKWMLWIAMLFVFPMVIVAQGNLTQTFTSANGMLIMSYPDGWTATEDDGLIRFNGDIGFLEINFYDNNGSGFAPVTALEYLEVGIGEEPDLRMVMEYNEPQELMIAGFPALQSGSNLFGQLHTVIDFGDGVLGKAIGFVQGDLAAATPTFMAMLNSIQYGEGTQAVAQETGDSMAMITPSNAAEVAQSATLGDPAMAVESVTFSPDGSLLGVALADGTAQLWNVETGALVATLPDHIDGASSIAFDSEGYSVLVGAGNGQVQFWEASTGIALGSLQVHETALTSLALQGDTLLLAAGAVDGSVKLWDTITATEIALDDHVLEGSVGEVAFSMDGTVLFAGGGNTIRMWNTDTGAVLTSLETEISNISSISTIGGGVFLLYGGADSAVWVWDLADETLPVLGAIDPPLSALAVNADVTLLASADMGGLRLWDIATTATLVTLPSPSGDGFNTVAFNMDSTLIASGGDTGGVILWAVAGDNSATAAPVDTGSTTQTTTTGETTPSGTGDTGTTCTFNAPGDANLRSGAGTNFDRAGSLSAGETVEIDGQSQGADGMTWYRLTNGAWVRSDVVGAPAACANVPVVSG
jgi:WD40 repeat protein